MIFIMTKEKLSNVFKHAVFDGWTRIKAMHKSQHEIMQKIKSAIDDHAEGFNYTDFKSEVSTKLAESKHVYLALAAKIEKLTADIKTEKEILATKERVDGDDAKLKADLAELETYHTNIKSLNKTKEVLDGAAALLEIPGAFEALCSGQNPFDDTPRFATIVDLKTDAKDYWGTSKSTFVSAALVHIANALNVDISKESLPIIYSSPRDNSDLTVDGIIIKLSGINIFHSGFVWGGHRMQTYDGPNPPEDALSYIETICHLPHSLISYDLDCMRRIGTNESTPISWPSTDGYKSAISFHIEPYDEMQVGDVLVIKYRMDSQDVYKGGGGFAAIVVALPTETNPSPTVITINRNNCDPKCLTPDDVMVDNIEGVALQEVRVTGRDILQQDGIKKNPSPKETPNNDLVYVARLNAQLEDPTPNIATEDPNDYMMQIMGIGAEPIE